MTFRARAVPLLSFLIALSALSRVSGQTTTRRDASNDTEPHIISFIGAFGDYQYNKHNAFITGLPGVPSCCPQYDGGHGNGMAFGGVADIPVSEAWSILLRLSYATHGGTLVANETKEANVNGSPFPALVEHTITPHIQSIGLEPMLGYSPVERLGVYAGARVAYVTKATFDQVERLIRPEGVGTFENGRRSRNEFTGTEIPDAPPLSLAVMAHVSYRLPMSPAGTTFLVPEISYSVGLNRIAGGVPWTIDGFRSGVSIQYALRSSPPPPPPPMAPPPPRVTAAVYAVGVDPRGAVMETPRITIEEFESVGVKPLLAFLFFDEGSDVLPARYATLRKDETADFKPDKLHNARTIDVYHHLLDIVGARMHAHPQAVLHIIGCNSGVGAEEANTGLSLSRAANVADYLKAVWDIPSERLRIEGRDLPESPSRSGDADGIAENRRVELASDDESILDPLITRSVERTITPDHIRFLPLAEADAGIQSWSITVNRDGKAVRSFRGDNAPDEHIDWNFSEDLPETSSAEGPLTYDLVVHDKAGQTRTSAEGTIHVEEHTLRQKAAAHSPLTTINRFNLILFDYDSPLIGKRNEQILSRYIRPEIHNDDRVSVAGYTDRMGDAAHNLTLSLQRAENTARALNHTVETVEGKGENVPTYDNNLPEGRFYNRTVEIVVVPGK